MPIYTKTGDKGQTSLFDKTRVSKAHVRVQTYGTIDELNSMIGAAAAELRSKNPAEGEARQGRQELGMRNELEQIQHDLLDIGSSLANPAALPIHRLEKRVQAFEVLIDELTAQMPTLTNFILPGGGRAGSLLHVARTIARRAERKIVRLTEKEEIDQNIVIYVNRLSDLFFTMARFVNHTEKQKETTWRKR